MNLSFKAIERVVSNNVRSNASFAKKLQRSGRVLLNDARNLTDEDLLGKLAEYGVMFSKESLRALIVKHDSAESIAISLFEQYSIGDQPKDNDWIWLSICVLWERWFQEKPSIEMLDDLMMEGYRSWEDRKNDQHEKKAADVWLSFWEQHIKPLIITRGFTSTEDLDTLFRGSHFVSNWFNDFRDALFNTGVDDKKYLPILLKYSEDWIELLPDDSQLALENCRRTIAECHTLLGNNGKAEELYAEWMATDPEWGWGYIGWSDTYHLIDKRNIDLTKAEELLRRGLAVGTVQDRSDIYDRLIGLLFDQNRDEEAEALRTEALEYDRKKGMSPKYTKFLLGDEDNGIENDLDNDNESGLPHARLGTKVGRNETCPCGSGKKYKKCCIN